MCIVHEIATLANAIQNCRNVENVEFVELGSYVVYLHVILRTKRFVMAYYPQQNRIAVDELLTPDGMEAPAQHWYKDFPAAKQKLVMMLDDVIRTTPRDN